MSTSLIAVWYSSDSSRRVFVHRRFLPSGEACSIITEAREQLAAATQTCNSKLERARALLPVIDDEIAAPEAQIAEDDQPEPRFTTDDDYVEATEKLVASKNLEDV